jgi:hypothetical protein
MFRSKVREVQNYIMGSSSTICETLLELAEQGGWNGMEANEPTCRFEDNILWLWGKVGLGIALEKKIKILTGIWNSCDLNTWLAVSCHPQSSGGTGNFETISKFDSKFSHPLFSLVFVCLFSIGNIVIPFYGICFHCGYLEVWSRRQLAAEIFAEYQ